MAAAGIARQHTTRNEPHQNGVAERANRTLAEGATSMLTEAHFPASFWGHAVSAFVHTHNRSPTVANSDNVPYTMLYGKKPDISYFRVFGCTAYVHVQKDQRKGLAPHTQKCVFIAYPSEYKGWTCYNPVTRKSIISKSVVFDERSFPGLRQTSESVPVPIPLPESLVKMDLPEQVGDDPRPVGVVPPTPSSTSSTPLVQPFLPSHSPSPPPAPAPRVPPTRQQPPDSTYVPPRAQGPVPELDTQRRNPRRTSRDHPPRQWWIVPKLAPRQDVVHEEEEERSDEEVESICDPEPDQPASAASAVDYFSLPEALEFAHFVAIERAEKVAAHDTHPKTYAEAMTRPDADEYHKAACKEIHSLVKNGTWELAKLPLGRKAIGVCWVFVVKRKADGSVDRYKARLVAQGYSQRPGFDFTETFAPTAKWAALRTILAIAAIEDYEIESVDISSAFLNGEIDHEIYIRQPEGFTQGDPDDVLRLFKGLYGLHQSGNLWYKKLDEVLVEIGFAKVRCDNSIWVYRRDDMHIIIPVFVDDMTLVGNDKAKIQHVKDKLRKRFKLRDLGPISFLLGVSIERDRAKQTLKLGQRQYILDLLERYNFSDCNPVVTPLDVSIKLDKSGAPSTRKEIEEMRSVPYIHAVGSLMYLAISTRPDIAYAVSLLGCFSANPGVVHWKAVKHLFRYLKGTLDLKLTFAPCETPNGERFVTYSDAHC